MTSPPTDQIRLETKPALGFLCALLLAFGCGTTTQRTATEQLLMSDAVDTAIAQIDFRTLSGEKVYLDTAYLHQIKGVGFVNAEYIISSLRQQLTAARCFVQENRDDADVIVEARVGALGTDGHEITYGVPQTGALSTAASVISGSPAVPVLPELSVGRTDAHSGMAKVVVFAYQRESRQPIWQSGIAKAESTSRNTWVLGAGPFQRGTIHDGIKFAGRKINNEDKDGGTTEVPVSYYSEHQFPVYNWPPAKTKTADLPKDTTAR